MQLCILNAFGWLIKRKKGWCHSCWFRE